MGWFERFIRALIYLGFIAIMFYILVWFLGVLGVVIPYPVIHILQAIFVLFAILVLYKLFSPVMDKINLWGDPPPKA